MLKQKQKIQDAINFLTKGRTTLVIAHRLSTILNSDKIYVIDGGKVIGEGKHDELLKNSEIYKNFYEKQIQKALMRIIYNFLVYIVIFLSPLIIIYRIFKKKENPKRFLEKFSINKKKKKEKVNLIWFHCSSVGEFLSIVPLIQEFEKMEKYKTNFSNNFYFKFIKNI